MNIFPLNKMSASIIAGKIWGIRNDLITGDYCSLHEIIAGLVHLEFSRGKM